MAAEDTPVWGLQRFVASLLRVPFRNYLTYLLVSTMHYNPFYQYINLTISLLTFMKTFLPDYHYLMFKKPYQPYFLALSLS